MDVVAVVKKLNEVFTALAVVEKQHANNELRERLINQSIERVRSWKAGVYRA